MRITCHSLNLINASSIDQGGDNEVDIWGSGIKVGLIDGCHVNETVDKLSPYYKADASPIDRFSHLHKPPVKIEWFHTPECPFELKHSLSDHGTFMASILSGATREVKVLGICNAKTRGIAPGCDLYIYISGCPNCFLSLTSIVKSIRAGISDELRLISLSLSPSLENDSITSNRFGDVTFEAFKKNILVCVCAGNSGPGARTIKYSHPWIFIIGACTNRKYFSSVIEVGVIANAKKRAGTKVIRKVGNVSVIGVFQGRSINFIEDDEFHEIGSPSRSLRGRYSVLHLVDANKGGSRKRMVFEERTETHAAGRLSLGHLFATLCPDDTDQLLDWQKKFRKVLVRIKRSEVVDDLRKCTVPNFSSRGPSPIYKGLIVPDLVAPGNNIFVSWPGDLQQIGGLVADQCVDSGTSVSTPFAAAAGGCRVMQRNPSWGAIVVKSACLTSAINLSGNKVVGNEFAYGAGLLNIDGACEAGLAFVETVENFDLFRQGQLKDCDLNMPGFAIPFPLSPSTTKLSRTLTNLDDRAVTYDGKITIDGGRALPEGVTLRLEPDCLVFDKKGAKQSFELVLEDEIGADPKETVSAGLVWKSRATCEGDKIKQVSSRIYLHKEYD